MFVTRTIFPQFAVRQCIFSSLFQLGPFINNRMAIKAVILAFSKAMPFRLTRLHGFNKLANKFVLNFRQICHELVQCENKRRNIDSWWMSWEKIVIISKFNTFNWVSQFKWMVWMVEHRRKNTTTTTTTPSTYTTDHSSNSTQSRRSPVPRGNNRS